MLAPALAPHEKQRIRLLVQAAVTAAAAVVAAVLAGLVAATVWHNPKTTFLAALLPFFGGGWLATSQLKTFKASCRSEALGKLADAIGLSFDDEAEPLGVPTLQQYALMPSFERSNYQDQFTGTEKGCAFRLYEARLEVRRGSGNTEHWVAVFDGQVILIDFPTPFDGVTVINRHSLFGERHPGLERIHLESSQFERAFEVYGSDQVGARELVHPVFMERLNALESALSGKRLRCAFVGGQLMVVVEGGDLFEIVDLFRPIPNRDAARKGVDGIDHVLKLIQFILDPPPNPFASPASTESQPAA